MGKFTANELAERCETELGRLWSIAELDDKWKSLIPNEIQEAVERSVNSQTKTYRYVLPTQVLAKAVDETLDSRSLQEGSDLPGSFDARSLCQKVVVPFDRANHNVLGGATEPYVNNPLRISSISSTHRGAQKNKAGFDDLCSVVDFLESFPKTARAVLACIVVAIRTRLATVQIVYPVPNRASLQQSMSLIHSYISEKTGGVRLQAVAVALFRAMGEKFQLFNRVETAVINAADASTGSVADLVCLDQQGQVVLAVEVKDRELRLRHVQDKLPAVRKQGVRELLFLVKAGITEADKDSVDELVNHEFVTGQNIYVVIFDRFLESCLVLFGEAGRRQFLIHIGQSIDEIKADLIHRQTWRDLLSQL